jgi:hypothetical protein
VCSVSSEKERIDPIYTYYMHTYILHTIHLTYYLYIYTYLGMQHTYDGHIVDARDILTLDVPVSGVGVRECGGATLF